MDGSDHKNILSSAAAVFAGTDVDRNHTPEVAQDAGPENGMNNENGNNHYDTVVANAIDNDPAPKKLIHQPEESKGCVEEAAHSLRVAPEPKIAIIKADGKTISSDDVIRIRKSLLSLGVKYAKDLHVDRYHFINTGIVNEGKGFLIVCGSQQTADVVNISMKDFWLQNGLKAFPIFEVSRPQIYTYAHDVITPPNRLIPLMELMNDGLGLHFEEWEINTWNSCDETTGTYICIDVPEEDAKIIEDVRLLAFECCHQHFWVNRPIYDLDA